MKPVQPPGQALVSQGGFSEERAPTDEPSDPSSRARLGSRRDAATPPLSDEPANDGPANDGPANARDDARYDEGVSVGQGAMGEVRAVLDRKLGRVVAKKTARDDGPTAARLAREVAIVASLEHPGIVPLYDHGEGPDGRPWYTMRLVRGETLARVLAQTCDPAGRLALVRRVAAAAQAVAAAHRADVVHRDLKPSNVMLGEDGATLVVDWGLARRADTEELPLDQTSQTLAPRLTVAGSILGTLAFMSPEQARGERVDARADVFALGAILYEVLTGRLAFPEGPLVSELDLAPLSKAPPDLTAVVRRALAPLDARYPSAAELASDLERFLDGRLVEAHHYSPLQRLSRLWRARRATVLAAVVAMLAIAATAAIAFVRVSSARDEAERSDRRTREALARADESNARLIVRLASEHARAGRRAEAERLLARAPMSDPEALGWRVAFGNARPRIQGARPIPEECTSLVSRGHTLACAGAGSIWVVDAEGREAWRVASTARRVELAWAGATLLVASEKGVEVLDVAGRSILTHRVAVARGSLVGSPDGAAAAVAGAAVVHWPTAAGEWLSLDPCRGKPPNALALGPEGVIAACDEVLVRYRGAEERSREDLGLGSLTALHASEEALLVGTRRGAVHRFEGDTTRFENLGDTSVVRVAPLGDWIAVEYDARGVRLWHPESGARETLPMRDETLLSATRRELLTRADDAIRSWSPGPPVARRIALGAGVSNLDARDGYVVAALRDGSIVLLRGHDGRPLAQSNVDDNLARWARVFRGRVVAQAAPPTDTVLELSLSQLAPLARWSAPPLGHSLELDGALIGADHGRVVVRLEPEGTHTLAVLASNTVDLAPGDGDLLWLGDDGALAAVETGSTRALPEARGAHAVTGLGRDVVLAFDDHLELRRRDGVLRARAYVDSPVEELVACRGGVAAAHIDGTVRFFDGQLRTRAIHRAHDERASSLAVDGDVVFSGGWDGVVARHDLSALDQAAEVYARELSGAWGVE